MFYFIMVTNIDNIFIKIFVFFFIIYIFFYFSGFVTKSTQGEVLCPLHVNNTQITKLLNTWHATLWNVLTYSNNFKKKYYNLWNNLKLYRYYKKSTQFKVKHLINLSMFAIESNFSSDPLKFSVLFLIVCTDKINLIKQ